MELSSRFVGMRLKDHHAEITWRRTMNYAASVDDANARYLDDEREGGVVAPPMLSAAVTWPVVERIREYLQADDFPIEVMATQVHYTEALEFQRPIRPGDRLTVKGRIAAIVPHRAGTLVVNRFDVVGQDGRPVFTEHMGALLRGVACVDEGSRAGVLPEAPPPAGPQVPIWESRIPIDPMRPYLYDGCTDIVFPIHTSKRFARRVGLPGPILQGTATLAYGAREIVNREAGGDPRRLKALFCRFTGMVMPGTTIRVQLVGKRAGTRGTDLYFIALNHEDRKAVSDGYAYIVPGDK